MKFKERLKELRKEKKLTQTKLASELNYGYTAIANYESGRNQPNLSDLIKLANFLQVSVDYLLGNSDVRHKAEKELWKGEFHKSLKQHDIFLDESDMLFLEMLYYKTNEFIIRSNITTDTITQDSINETFKTILENCFYSFSTSFFRLLHDKTYCAIAKDIVMQKLNIK